MKTRHLTYTCTECDKKIAVEFIPADPGKLSGPPELCYPPEAAEVSPTTCPECGQEWDEFDVISSCEEAIQDAEDYAADCKYDQMRDDEAMG